MRIGADEVKAMRSRGRTDELEAAPTRGLRLGIRSKLLAAVGAIGAMTVAASVVAWVSFGEIGATLEEITVERMPLAVSALELSRASAELAAGAPALDAAANPAERKAALERLQQKDAEMRRQLQALKRSGAASTEQVERLATEMAAAVAALDRAVQGRLAAAAERTKGIAALRKAHENFLQVTAPLVDDANFNLTLGLQSIDAQSPGDTLGKELARLADVELVAYEAMQRLSSEANLLVGLLTEAAILPDAQLLVPARDRYLASSARLSKSLDAADKVQPNNDRRTAAEALTSFGEGAAGLFETRRSELAQAAAAREALGAGRELAGQLASHVQAIVAQAEAGNQEAAARARSAIGGGKALLAALAAASLLGAALIGWLYVGRCIAARLAALAAAMREIADGRLDAEIPRAGADEIGEMAAALVVFRDAAAAARAADAEAEAERLRAAEQRRADRLRVADDLEAGVRGVIEVVARSAAKMRESAEAMTGAAADAELRATTAVAGADQASGNVGSVADSTKALADAILEIGRQAQDSSALAGEAVSQSERTNAAVHGLSAAADRIGDVVKMIDDVAAQTNLLALNATIEAARAGEAGRGFAVVAGEVKSLAGQTAKATQDIAAQIAAMQTATGQSVHLIEAIGATIERIASASANIAAAVEQQQAATSAINHSVQQAAAGAAEVSTNMAGMSHAVAVTGGSAQGVLEVARELSRQAEALGAELDRCVEQLRAA